MVKSWENLARDDVPLTDLGSVPGLILSRGTLRAGTRSIQSKRVTPSANFVWVCWPFWGIELFFKIPRGTDVEHSSVSQSVSMIDSGLSRCFTSSWSRQRAASGFCRSPFQFESLSMSKALCRPWRRSRSPQHWTT